MCRALANGARELSKVDREAFVGNAAAKKLYKEKLNVDRFLAGCSREHALKGKAFCSFDVLPSSQDAVT